jgi:ABC-type multidrug transport system permease subunit
LVSAGLVATSVEIFFRTNSFQGEYKEISDALFVSTKVELLSEIDSLIQQRKAAQQKVPTQPSSTLIFPEADVDYEEDILSSIREIGADADNWLTSMRRGKTYLHVIALLTFILAVILFVFVGFLLFLPLSEAFLFLEYFTGPILIFLGVYAARYEGLVRDLDKAYIELKKVHK